MAKNIPYAGATSGHKAREEITRLLQRFGCDSVGFMDEFSDQSVLLAFVHRGRPVQLRASAKGWAQMFLKEQPWSSRMRKSRADYERDAIKQGMIAINSILRDWVKGQVTAVECGVLSFEAIFIPYMLTTDGVSVLERMTQQGLLPAPVEIDVSL